MYEWVLYTYMRSPASRVRLGIPKGGHFGSEVGGRFFYCLPSPDARARPSLALPPSTAPRVHGCERAGITVRGGDPALISTKVFDGRGAGVAFIGPGTRGRMEGCEIWGCAHAGIAVKKGASSLVFLNEIHDCLCGILVSDRQTAPSIQGNDVWLSGDCGVWLLLGCAPILRGNALHDHYLGRACGIFVHGSAGGAAANAAADNSLARNVGGAVFRQLRLPISYGPCPCLPLPTFPVHTGSVPGVPAVVLIDFEARSAGELSVGAGAHVFAEFEVDGWLHVRVLLPPGAAGGYVPRDHVYVMEILSAI